MANQTSVNPDLSTMEPSPGSMVGNIAEFGNDIATLVELQTKLAALDAKDCLARATIPAVILIAGGAVALSSLPVLILGAADLLAIFTNLTLWASRMIVAVVIMVVAAIVAFLSYREITLSIHSFRRSSEELTRNLSWVRTVLVHSGRAASRNRV